MNVFVQKERFLSVPCDAEERIVFDRKDGKYHLLRESAARLWEKIEKGGVFALEPPSATVGEEDTEGEEDPVELLRQAGLLELVDEKERSPAVPRISRRMWIGRTSKLAAATAVLPLVASLMTPRIALGGGGYGDSSTQDLQGGPSADLFRDAGDGSTSSTFDTQENSPYQTYGTEWTELWQRWREWLERFWWSW